MPPGTESWPRALARLLLVAGLADLVVACVVLALGWRLGWSTREQWGSAFAWAGILALGMGGLFVGGSWASRPVTLGYAASAGPASLDERVRSTMRDTFTGYRRLVLLFLIAVPLIAFGVWLDPGV